MPVCAVKQSLASCSFPCLIILFYCCNQSGIFFIICGDRNRFLHFLFQICCSLGACSLQKFRVSYIIGAFSQTSIAASRTHFLQHNYRSAMFPCTGCCSKSCSSCPNNHNISIQHHIFPCFFGNCKAIILWI